MIAKWENSGILKMASLPNEIFLEIVKHFRPINKFHDPSDVLEEYNITKNTLASLCLVSRTWRDIAQPLLYRTYIKTEDTDTNIDHDEYNEAKIEALEAQGIDIQRIPKGKFEHTHYRKPIPLEMFIRTMIERPDLTEKVECLSISNYWDEDAKDAKRGLRRTDVNKALGEAMFNASFKVPPQKTPWAWRFPSEWQQDWRKELREGDEVAEVALLMVLLPNIRHLDLGTSSETYGTHVQDLWRQLLGSQSGETLFNVDYLSQTETPLILSHLEFLSARVDRPTYGDAPDINTVEEVLTILSLKNFYCAGLQQSWSEDMRLPLAHIQQVFINDCWISEEALICIIESCKQLTALDVIWYRECCDGLTGSFLTALIERKETLERLSLLLPPFAMQRVPELSIHAPFDLRQLTNLKVLSIDYEIIFSERETRPDEDHHDNPKFPYNLPRSIENLNIQYCRLDEDMAECASYLLDCRHKYDKLKYIQLTYENFEPKNDAEKDQLLSLSCVAGIFKAMGIDLRVVSEDNQILDPHPAFEGRKIGQSS